MSESDDPTPGDKISELDEVEFLDDQGEDHPNSNIDQVKDLELGGSYFKETARFFDELSKSILITPDTSLTVSQQEQKLINFGDDKQCGVFGMTIGPVDGTDVVRLVFYHYKFKNEEVVELVRQKEDTQVEGTAGTGGNGFTLVDSNGDEISSEDISDVMLQVNDS